MIPYDYFDAHCHLSDPRIASEVEEMLMEAKGLGLRSFLLAGVNPTDWGEQEDFCEKWSSQFDISLSAGLHPKFVSENESSVCDLALAKLEKALVLNPNRIVGEIGLDYRSEFLKLRNQDHQKHYLRLQIQLAKTHARPCILHFVRCHDDAIAILKEADHPHLKMIHSFNASLSVAKKYLELGCFLSIGSGLLNANNQALWEAVRGTPIDRLLVESDAPDQPPFHLRGTWNRPATVVEIVKRLSEIKALDLEEVRITLKRNFELFIS